MLKNTISTILNENANTNDRKKIIRHYCIWSGMLCLVGGLLSSAAVVWVISYMSYIHKNINQYIQNNGSTGIVLAMVVFFLMACCLLLVTATAFVRVTVRLCTFAKPSKVRCAELTITGKRQKSANVLVSAKTDKGIIQADCLSKTYGKIIPGQTCGLFYSIDGKTVKVSLSKE